MHDHFAERIKWCQEMREAATRQLSRIEDDGWRFHAGAGNAPMRDVTDEIADRERRTIANMTKLIAGYEARDA